ncbi:hypothetical protein D9M72_562710 [compost metagenome]
MDQQVAPLLGRHQVMLENVAHQCPPTPACQERVTRPSLGFVLHSRLGKVEDLRGQVPLGTVPGS